MPTCPDCQYENPDDASFCARCQRPLTVPAPTGAGVQVGGDAGVVRVHDQSQTINNFNISMTPQKLADLMRVSGQEAGTADEAERLALSGGALAPEAKLDSSEFVVSADELDIVRSVFVAPAGLQAAQTALSRHLLVLTGAPDSGRYTAALALASDLQDQLAQRGLAPRLCALPQRLVVSTRSLLSDNQAANTILVVYEEGETANAVARELGQERSQLSVVRIRKTLSQVNSYLILVCGQNTAPLSDAAIRQTLQDAGVLVEIGAPPAGQVLERHVLWVAGDDTWQRLRAGLGERVETLAQRLRFPRRIAKFAQFYARKLAEGCQPNDPAGNWRLAERLAATALDVRAEARTMFKGLADDRLRWLAITLCLFHDTRLTDFWRLFDLLWAHGLSLQESRQPGAPPAPAAAPTAPPAPPPSLFAENDADMLLAVHGEVTTVETRLETGPGVARRVRFDDGEMQNAMLGFLRENYHALLIGLVPLLERLVKEGGLEVRIAAARALGAIGALDFERLLQPLLERWRDSDAAFLRAAVGYALDAALAENQAEAVELLRSWGKVRAVGGERWKAQWTVAAVLKVIGQQRIELALAEMQRLGQCINLVRDPQALDRVLPSFSFTLVVLCLQGHLRPILRATTRWMQEPPSADHTLRLTAALVWAQVMEVYNGLAANEKQPPAAGAASGQPCHEMTRLLRADEESGAWTENVVQAFLRWYDIVQDDERQHAVVLDFLRTWAEDAAGDELARAAVQRLLEHVWQRLAREKGQVLRYYQSGLQRWRADRRRFPGAAALATVVLTRKPQ